MNVLLTTAVCFPPSGCLNGGYCYSPGLCACASGWTGEKCDEGISLNSICNSYITGARDVWHLLTSALGRKRPRASVQ